MTTSCRQITIGDIPNETMIFADGKIDIRSNEYGRGSMTLGEAVHPHVLFDAKLRVYVETFGSSVLVRGCVETR